MHELAIADSIVQSVLSEVERQGYGNLIEVGLRVGELTDIVTDSLCFGFEVLSRDTILRDTKLVIEQVPVSGECLTCRKKTSINIPVFQCEYCGGFEIKVVNGQELDIAYLKVDDDGDNDETEQRGE